MQYALQFVTDMEPRIPRVVQVGDIPSRRPNCRISYQVWGWQPRLPDDSRCWPHGSCVSTGHRAGHVDPISGGELYKTPQCRVVEQSKAILSLPEGLPKRSMGMMTSQITDDIHVCVTAPTSPLNVSSSQMTLRGTGSLEESSGLDPGPMYTALSMRIARGGEINCDVTLRA